MTPEHGLPPYLISLGRNVLQPVDDRPFSNRYRETGARDPTRPSRCGHEESGLFTVGGEGAVNRPGRCRTGGTARSWLQDGNRCHSRLSAFDHGLLRQFMTREHGLPPD